MPSSADDRARWRFEALVGIAGGVPPSCVCCGERRPWALVFDHIDGGGVAHRRANAANPTVRLVRRHYRETGEWPTDVYQVLCATCNHGRRVAPDGACPHAGEGVTGLSEKWKQAAYSYLRVFAATILALFLADGADVFAVDALEARTWLAAGVAAVLPVAIRALNPADGTYGLGSR